MASKQGISVKLPLSYDSEDGPYRLTKDLKENGVNRINVSLDTINESNYNKITRFGDLSKVIKGNSGLSYSLFVCSLSVKYLK